MSETEIVKWLTPCLVFWAGGFGLGYLLGKSEGWRKGWLERDAKETEQGK